MQTIAYKRGGGGVLILPIFVHTYYVDDPTGKNNAMVLLPCLK